MQEWVRRIVDGVGRSLIVLALGTLLPGLAWASDPGSPAAKVVKQGDVLLVDVGKELGAPLPSSVSSLRVVFDGREWPTASTPEGVLALIGIDMATEPGLKELIVSEPGDQGTPVVLRRPIVIEEGEFGVQNLTLPDKQVDLDAATLQRVRTEQREMLDSMEAVTPKVWDGDFVRPTEGPLQHTFGRRRVINGQPRNPHTGEDITAAKGAPVVAMNHGVVRLVAEQFFSGKGIVVDHGLGLYSMYFHLSEILVKVGDRVDKNQVIGRVGATGRVSGPHLHWGVRLNGARVNPLALNGALGAIRPISN